jgi:hypothetical protein
MEASMHGAFEKPGDTIKGIYRNWGMGVFALPVLILIALVGMAMTHQGASDWLSEAMQAEFVRTGLPDVAPAQVAQPAGPIRAAKAN